MYITVVTLIVLVASISFGGVTSCGRTSDKDAVETGCEAKWYDSKSQNSRCYDMQSQLTDAVVAGNLSLIRTLMDRGANVNGGFDQSIPVLEVAASAGKIDVVTVLINAGANINRVRPLGQTALKAAVINQHVDSVRLLIEKGADVCEKTEATAWQYAVEDGNTNVVMILERAGANKCS